MEKQLSVTSSVAVPIGDAISETSLYLVTEQQPYKEVGYYEEGELWIGGVGVATGYLHAPDLTEQRFLKNPFGEGYVYRTGDVVKRLQDGTNQYVFVRRMDDQVKIGGFRIELQEIEVVYGRHSSVEQAVALVRDGKLVIYLKLAPGLLPSASVLADIRAASSRSLTYYMMPKATVVVNSFPQTANGKLDRKALPDPPASADESDDSKESDPPPVPEADNKMVADPVDSKFTGIELTTTSRKQYLLAQHICEVVNAVRGRRPGINASFAAIGVDSLGAIVLVRQLTDSFGGYRVTPNTLFAPGMTAYKLAGILLPKLREEKPDILKRLGIDSYDLESRGGSENNTVKTGDDFMISEAGLAAEEEDADEPSEFDTQFDTAIALSRDYLEGIRGFFAFMVLWDHYSPVPNSVAWLSDVNLFILISGVTTSLQLRTPPRYTKSPISGEKILIPRPHFNCSRFFLTRVIGIFPIYYIALLLCTPAWIALTGPYKKQCVPLYVLNLDAWWRPNCHVDGPNYVEFASVVWSMFLLYGLFRSCFSVFQNWILREYPGTKMSAVMAELMYNRIEDRSFGYAWVFFLVVIVIALLIIGRYCTFSLVSLFI